MNLFVIYCCPSSYLTCTRLICCTQKLQLETLIIIVIINLYRLTLINILRNFTIYILNFIVLYQYPLIICHKYALKFKILHDFRHNLSQKPDNKQGDPNDNAFNLCSERFSVRISARRAVILNDILHKFDLCLQAHAEMVP
jgi:hypothetical protein